MVTGESESGSERLARELGVEALTGAAWALATEAVRIKQRLDQLDAYLAGDPDAWLRMVARFDPLVVDIVIDKALAEARQQAVALKTVLAELRAAGAGGQEKPLPIGKADDLAQRRADRQAAG